MAYVVGEPCVNCKYGDCVDACPVDCFYQDDRMLYINPAECIDCDACKPECPVEAILPDTEDDTEKWVEINREYSEKWPNITQKGEPPADGEEYKDTPDKFDKFFSAEPGQGS